MPLITLTTSEGVNFDQQEMIRTLSQNIAALTGKPESYVMVLLEPNKQMSFAGNSKPCCYVEVKSIGSLNPSKMSACLCSLIEQATSIPIDRIYINFQDIKSNFWGFNSSTFG